MPRNRFFFGLTGAAAGLCAALCAPAALAQPTIGEGRFELPAPGAVVASGDAIEVRWTPSSEARERELVLSLDGGLTFPIRVTPELPARVTDLRWTVPDLPTRRARLAVRSGSGETSEDESLEVISGEFAIVSVAASDPGSLLRGAREWWTREALLGESADDPFDQAMGGSTERLTVAAGSIDIGEPNPSGAPAPIRCAARFEASSRRARAASARPASPRPIQALALRL